jgi:heterodisulfide reductase subunit A
LVQRIKRFFKKNVGNETPRIGVFVCHCGTNIASTVDVEKIAEAAKELPYVVHTDCNLFTCSDATQQQIKDAISEHNLNRVVVASCTPRTHEPLFQNTIKEGGLNPYLFEMANIREHCSWVHRESPEEATDKAMELLKMAVAKSARLKELSQPTFDLIHTAAVIGGGIAGISAALHLARSNIKTYLIEKEKELGGRLRDLSKFAITNVDANGLLNKNISELDQVKSNLSVLLETELKKVSGSIGNFELEYEKSGKPGSISVGAVVIATGADVYKPDGEFEYNKFEQVLTNLDLENNLKGKSPLEFSFGKPKKAVYILCVGSRTQPEGELNDYVPDGTSNPGCSRICCDVGIKQATALQNAGIETTILYRDIRTFDSGAETDYYNASKAGVRFIRYEQDHAPKVTTLGKVVLVKDSITNETLEIYTDMIVLGCGIVPRINDTALIQSLFKIPKGADGFFLEAHPKLAPLETTTGGIYLCGTAQYPKSTSESITQGYGAALKAVMLLTQEALTAEPFTAIVDSSICWGCGTCVDVCIYGAPGLGDNESGTGKVSYINPTLCKGCGSCAARCPSGAINANLFTNLQLIAMVKALGDEVK